MLPRSSAACLLQLGDSEQAARLADEELALARAAGTARGIGVAARSAGIVHQDMELLKTYREGMVKRKPPLDPGTIKERTNKYIAHVAFHLYQMYNEQKRRNDEREKLVEPDDLRAEINRVGSTLIRVMEVSR